MFISKCCGCLTEDRILESVTQCPTHDQPYVFLCPKKDPKCRQKPLLCHACLPQHKNHEFQEIQNFFTPQFKNTLKSGTSLNGHAVRRMNDHVLSDISKMRSKLNRHIDKIQMTLKQEMDKLLPKYPLSDKFGIPGTSISPQNITMILDIYDREKVHIWVPAAEKYIRSLLGQVTAMLGNLLDDLDEHMINKPYQAFTQAQSQKLIQQFVQKYEGVYDPDKNHFSFSKNDKHDNIKVHQQGRIAKYVHNSPSQPGVITTNPFTKSSNTIYLKIGKVDKTLLVFDASLVVVGVCVPTIVRIFGYRELIQPAHGAYMIGSNGKSYHSTLDQYHKKSLAFQFSQGDTLAIRVDFAKKQVHFSKWGFFQRHFSMPLTVKDEEMQVLRPCVMFHGERGAIVQIVNEKIYKRKQGHQHIYQI